MKKKWLITLLLCSMITLMFAGMASAATNDGKSPATAIVISEADRKYEWTLTHRLWSDDGLPLGEFEDKFYQLTPARQLSSRLRECRHNMTAILSSTSWMPTSSWLLTMCKGVKRTNLLVT